MHANRAYNLITVQGPHHEITPCTLPAFSSISIGTPGNAKGDRRNCNPLLWSQ